MVSQNPATRLFVLQFVQTNNKKTPVLRNTALCVKGFHNWPTVYPKKYAHGYCFVVVIYWLIFPYSSGLLPWHCDNLTIAPVPAKQPRWIWINTSCKFIMNNCITTKNQSTTKPCAYFFGYTVLIQVNLYMSFRPCSTIKPGLSAIVGYWN